MRHLPPLAVLAVLLALAPSAGAGTLFVITGRGWGHGVGMSQWGAYGLAKEGKGYKQILAHYYPGTSLGKRGGKSVRVLLADQRSSLAVGAGAAFKADDPVKAPVTFPAGTLTVKKTRTGRIKAGGRTFRSPVTFRATTAPLRLGSIRYRGTLVVSIVGGKLRAVNRVGLESYVKGVVPNESPDSWGNEGAQAALKAQAVAARSYALSTGGHCGGGLFCATTFDQVYGGYEAELRGPNGARATDATAGKVVLHDGAVARTFFHSSSGGRTAASADVWGGAFPYLRSVRDAADLNAANPRRHWRVLRTGPQLASQLDLARAPSDGTVTRDGSGRVASMTFSRPGWSAPVSYPDDTLRFRLAVNSTRFWLGVLGLTSAKKSVEWGRRTSLSALVRGLSKVSLKRRPAGGVWKTMRGVEGAETVAVEPRKTNRYRLGTSFASVTVKVRVRPRLRFSAEQGQGSLTGSMRPRRAGTTIAIQRRVSGSWRTVATTTLDSAGSWTAKLTVKPGSYRAFAAPGDGLAAGASPTREVSG